MEMGGEKTTQLVFFFSFQIGDKEKKRENNATQSKLSDFHHRVIMCWMYLIYLHEHPQVVAVFLAQGRQLVDRYFMVFSSQNFRILL